MKTTMYGLLAATCGLACSSSSGGAPMGQGGGGAGGAASTASGLSMPMGPTATLHGSVQDTAGEPIYGALLSLCSSACWGQSTASDGSFSYVDVPADKYKLEVRGAPDGPATGVVLFALELDADEEATLDDPIIVPETGSGTLLGEEQQDVMIDSVLTLQLDPQGLTLPFGETEEYLAGVQVDASQWPPNDIADDEVLAQWSLNPFGAVSDAPISVQLATGLGLRAGQSVYFYTVDQDTGYTERIAEGEVGPGADSITTKPAQGIQQITWLAVGSSPND